ncbi:hypothetical protein HUJ04_003621 [Dendroctonus ponderosae]|nr:hypothetical protein HUJ04_003621 [Dendroctonus ponderosae]
MKKTVKCIFLAVIVLCVLVQDNEARRKIVRGRKAVTRQYLRPLAIPAWAIIVLVAIGQLVIGAFIYLLLKVVILDKPLQARYAPAPLSNSEETQPA